MNNNEFTNCLNERDCGDVQSRQSKIKIAYICLCHMDPDFIGRMARALKYKDDAIFIHVDNKVGIQPFQEACDSYHHVHFVHNRIDNYWGGYNSVEATILTIKLALATDHYDRFVLLQGQDYPLKSPKEIHEFFLRNRNVEFC